MVSVELQGGLGNQMFQIAACIAYAKRYGLDYNIPATASNSHGHSAYFTHLRNPKWNNELPVDNYNEKTFHYSEIPHLSAVPHDRHNLIFKGYFQSYKYFENQKGEVIRAFDMPKFDNNAAGIVAVHVRRGDYLQHPGKHPVVSEEYLSKAIKYFQDLGYKKFSFFSDDPLWCSRFVENQESLKQAGYYMFHEQGPAIKDMAIMSQGEHQIMSNSTFSWWAAYLNPNPDKIVIYPARWFGPEYADKDTIKAALENKK